MTTSDPTRSDTDTGTGTGTLPAPAPADTDDGTGDGAERPGDTDSGADTLVEPELEGIAVASMRVLVAGAHGKVGRRVLRRLADTGHTPVAMVRDPGQAEEVRAQGAADVVVADVTGDLAGDLAAVLPSIDAIVYSVGSGPGSGAASKAQVDQAGSDRLVELAELHLVPRYVMVSSQGAEDPSQVEGDMRAYLQAKHDADERLMASGLRWTVLRPGSLTDEVGSGMVRVTTAPARGEVSRDDVAAVIVACLTEVATVGRVLSVHSGNTLVPEAVALE